jgi:hypothetical protein
VSAAVTQGFQILLGTAQELAGGTSLEVRFVIAATDLDLG